MRYGVIGAGVLGLTAALRLAEQGHAVTVLERGSVPGGLAASFEVAPGVWLERYYHHLFETDRAAIRLIEEVGLGDLLEWHRPASTVLVDGEPIRLDSAGALFRFSPLGIMDRVRMGFAIGLLKAIPSASLLERSTADRWMRRVVGRRGYAVVWLPLLRAKFGVSYPEVSMAWLWARIHDRTTRLGYLRGGFHGFYSALATRANSLGASVEYSVTVESVEPQADGGIAVTGDRHGGRVRFDFDRVVSTLPTALTARMTPGLGDAFLARHPPPAALGAHCLVLALDRPLTGVYWIGDGDEHSPFLAVVEHTAMTGTHPYGGRTLVYLGAYRPHGDPIPRLALEEQVTMATEYLTRLRADFSRSWITDAWTFDVPFAQPVVGVDFKQSIPTFETPVQGLLLATMFQVYPHDRGQNYSIELAERLVRYLADRERE